MSLFLLNLSSEIYSCSNQRMGKLPQNEVNREKREAMDGEELIWHLGAAMPEAHILQELLTAWANIFPFLLKPIYD